MVDWQEMLPFVSELSVKYLSNCSGCITEKISKKIFHHFPSPEWTKYIKYCACMLCMRVRVYKT